MNGLLGVYLQQWKISLAETFQYRAAMAIWLIGHVLEPLLYLVVWSAVAGANGGRVGGMGRGDFAAYFIALLLVNHVTYTWIMWEMEHRIRHGALSFALLKPLHPVHADIAANLASKLITFPVILLAAGALALLFKPAFHPSSWSVLAFLPSLLLAFLLRFALEWVLALAAFWTTRIGAVNQAYFVTALFFSGQIAPLALLPSPMAFLSKILPFRWTAGFPVDLLLGRLDPHEALHGFLAQGAWILGILLVARVLWRAALRRYSAVGS
ncbi:MAG: ABC-2 family transporter protein [Spirochaetes bacterium]|nr:ABC-2 family transporter protein [Spirochaetota bacterium]